jgi:hypothetical protein
MDPIKAVTCELNDDGLSLTFSDGKIFVYSQAVLFATRFTHGNLVAPEKGRPDANKRAGVSVDDK